MTELANTSAFMAGEALALIVGCGGMGTSIARALGRRHPLLMIDVNPATLETTVDGLKIEGFNVSGRVCDITDTAQTQALGDYLGDGPGVRALAHVAAVGMSIGDWRKMMDVDLLGAQLIADAIGPHMVRGGAAVFISSLASYLPKHDAALDALLDNSTQPGFLDALVAYHGGEPDFDWAYNYAKLGVNRLAERLAAAWGPKGARAVSLSPGMINSPMARAEGPTLPSHDGTDSRVTRADKVKEIPLGREGSLLEITNVVDFLLSDGASFLTGVDITVDGGHRAVWRHNGTISR